MTGSEPAGQRFNETDHAWNAVRLEGTWHLVESTWGAGSVEFRKYVADYRPAWFDMDPRLFALNHMPEDPRWLLLGKAMTLGDYERAPYIPTYELEKLVDAGFTTGELLQLLPFAPVPELFGSHARAFKAMGGTLADILAYLSEGAFPEAWLYDNVAPALVEFPRTAKLRPERSIALPSGSQDAATRRSLPAGSSRSSRRRTICSPGRQPLPRAPCT
jgi:hypothetical protein